MSDRFFHGYWRLKSKVGDLEHEITQRMEYAQDLEKGIKKLEAHIRDLEELITHMEVIE